MPITRQIDNFELSGLWMSVRSHLKSFRFDVTDHDVDLMLRHVTHVSCLFTFFQKMKFVYKSEFNDDGSFVYILGK